jgi:hypothetical protein
MQYPLDKFQPVHDIDQGSDKGTEGTKPVIIGKQVVGQGSEMFRSVPGLFPEDDLGRIHTVRAGYLASPALAAQLYPLVNGCLIFRAETLGVGP